jgi:hypothetical protein
MSSIATPKQSNPHFNHADRAPYELGRLLLQLPSDFPGHAPVTRETLLIAQAAASHANIANDIILRGLEAIGSALVSAVENKELPLDNQYIKGAAELIQYLAVEAQFMQETLSDFEHVVRKHGRVEA